MDRGTQALLDDLFEQAAAELAANGFTKVSATLAIPTRKRIQHAGEYLLERATERFPTLDPYVSSRSDGTVTLVLDDHKKK
ncbi:hypothetical protein NG726_14425 [Pseudomonas sp. MOB-449]|nr:hypothetical protein [Pseudomonas sp. MOB-449]